jgi:hypothetical protein
MKAVLLIIVLSSSSMRTTQVNTPDSDPNPSTPAPQPVSCYQRPASHGRIIPNIVDDQSKIWLFPAKLNKKSNWIPAATILGTTAAFVVLDSWGMPISRRAISRPCLADFGLFLLPSGCPRRFGKRCGRSQPRRGTPAPLFPCLRASNEIARHSRTAGTWLPSGNLQSVESR